jgi:hypothetical protein
MRGVVPLPLVMTRQGGVVGNTPVFSRSAYATARDCLFGHMELQARPTLLLFPLPNPILTSAYDTTFSIPA